MAKAAVASSYQGHNIDLVAYHDLGGRPAFKLAMQEASGRWYLYMGHLWHRGWSILDVTDPVSPKLVAFIPGPENTWTIQVQVAGRKMITALERIAPGWGGAEGKAFSEGFLTWDVSEPTKPRQLGQYKTNSTGTHRNFYDGGTLVHAAGGAPGFERKIYQIVDISDPTKPRQISRFWLPEQEEGKNPDGGWYSLHGPPHVEGKRAYLSYGAGGAIILDISDLTQPRLVSQLLFRGISDHHGIHTFIPLARRGLALVNDEAINEEVAPVAAGQERQSGQGLFSSLLARLGQQAEGGQISVQIAPEVSRAWAATGGIVASSKIAEEVQILMVDLGAQIDGFYGAAVADMNGNILLNALGRGAEVNEMVNMASRYVKTAGDAAAKLGMGVLVDNLLTTETTYLLTNFIMAKNNYLLIMADKKAANLARMRHAARLCVSRLGELGLDRIVMESDR